MKRIQRSIVLIGFYLLFAIQTIGQDVLVFGEVNSPPNDFCGLYLYDYELKNNSYSPGYVLGGTVPAEDFLEGFSSALCTLNRYGTEKFYEINSSFIYPIKLNGSTVRFFGEGTRLNIQGQYVFIRYSFDMPKPGIVTASSNSGNTSNFCSNNQIRLATQYNGKLFSNSIVNSFIHWEYSTNDNPSTWILLESEGKNGWGDGKHTYYFNPALKIAALSNSQKNIRFRSRISAVYSDVTYYSDYSTPSDYYTFLPPPPVVNAGQMQLTPSCYNQDNGKLEIPGSAISSDFNDIRWLLRPGNVTQPCDPAAGNCGDIYKQSNGAIPRDNGITIEGIAAGTYTLWVLNPGQESGNCYQPIPITISKLSELQITNPANSNISCYGGNDGVINLSASGSDAASGYYFTLKNPDGAIVVNEQRGTDNTVQWKNLPAGSYRAEARDGACASTIKYLNITLTQPPQVTGDITLTQPTCSSPGNGSIAIIASEGPALYNYILAQNGTVTAQSGSTPNRNHTFNNLGSGAYTVTIQNADYGDCTGWKKDVTLNAAAPLSLALSESNWVSCNGGSDGSLKLTASGGSGTYQYVLSNANTAPTSNTSGIFTGLTAGNYQVRLTNSGNGCNDEVTGTFPVYEQPPLQVQLQTTNISCNGANNGKIQSVVSGGSGSYQYNWQQLKDGNWQSNSFWFSTDAAIEGLEPGTYRLIVNDAQATDCSITAGSVTITEPAPLQITGVAIQQAVCKADGARINITASGGDGNYTFAYSLNEGASFSNFTNATPLHTTGNYTLQVTDGKGCNTQNPAAYNIVLPAAALDFTTTLSAYNGFNISCSAQADGQININASGGNDGGYSGYQYKLNDGTWQNSNRFSNLTAGNYTVTTKDGRGCEVSKTVTLTEPSVKLDITQTDISCYGESTGALLVKATGGAAPYTLTLNGAAADMNFRITNLAQGNYQLQITDANRCVKDTAVTIQYTYPAIVPQLTVTDIRCYGSRGNVAITATGGDGNYTYHVSANNWQTQSTWLNTDSLTAGTYQFTTSDGTGCTVNVPGTVEITAPSAPLEFTSVLSNYNGYNISCFGGSNGFAQITATGGNGSAYNGYTYALNDNTFESSSLLQNIAAGNQTLKVQDARGCIAESPVTFTQSPTQLILVLISQQNTACANTTTGSVTVKGSGGTGNLSYSIDATNWQPSSTFNNLAAGNYTVMVKDMNDCIKSLNIQIASNSPAIVIDNIVLNDIVCYGGTGALLVTKHGGTGTLTQQYSLNNAAYTNFTNSTALSPGNYTIRVKDEAGCYSNISDAFSITAPPAPLTLTATTSNYNGVQVSCYEKNDGAIQFAASGGNGGGYTGYQYSFNQNQYNQTSAYSGLPAGTYNIMLKDARGCIVEQTIELQQPAAPVAFGIEKIEHLVCGASPTGKILLQPASGGTAPYNYRINDQAWQASTSFETLFAGSYTVQVKDANGCLAEQPAVVNTQFDAITATASITPVRCYGEQNGSIEATVSGGAGAYTYQWNNTSAAQPVLQNAGEGKYVLHITDGAGCSNSYEYNITQPNALAMQLRAPAICDGYTNGQLTATVTGGTPPYRYALNSQALQTANTYSGLTPALYTVQAQDANGCTITGNTSIDKLNTKPDVNFLIATRKNALDTLAVKEISLPAPDNVVWAFHPDAQLMGQQDNMPLVKFNAPGTYWAEMTGYWGTCMYTLRKDIVINPYDPLAGPGYSLPVRVIDTVMLSPNPNDGNFRLQVKLNRKQQAAVYIYHIGGSIVEKRQYSPALLIDDRFAITNNYGSGTYLLRVVTENDSRDVKFIITR